MIEAKKPLIAHNCLFDMVHIFHRFVEAVTEMEFQEFQTKFNEAFPLYV
jgi:hypothetical protein